MPLTQAANVLCNVGAGVLNSVTSLHEFVNIYWRIFGNKREVVLKLVVIQSHPCRAAGGLWLVSIPKDSSLPQKRHLLVICEHEMSVKYDRLVLVPVNLGAVI